MPSGQLVLIWKRAAMTTKKNKPPRFTPAFRELHRAEIRRLMKHGLNRKWEALYTGLLTGLMFFGFGLRLLIHGTDADSSMVFAFICFLLSILFLGLYLGVSKSREQGGVFPETLSLPDLAIQSLLMIAPIVAGLRIDWAVFAGLSLALLHGSWMTYARARPYWRIWYFRAAREYFRDLNRQKVLPAS